jgi:hypothetical protein
MVDLQFWVGILIGAVVAVIFTLFARPLEHALDRLGERRARDMAGQIAEASSREKSDTRDWLVVQLIEIAVIGSVTGIASSAFYTAGNAISWATDPRAYDSVRWYELGLNMCGAAISILGSILVLRVASNAIRTARLLRRGKVVDKSR